LTQAFCPARGRKRRWAIPGIGGARGYTPFRTEIAKGALVSDLKEFWHIGRDLPEGHPLAGSMPPNVWPETPRASARRSRRCLPPSTMWARRSVAHRGLAGAGGRLVRARHRRWQFGAAPAPLPARARRARRRDPRGAHEDINLITLLLGAEEAGLELRTREGNWIEVSPRRARW
jgi:isopenicillin N synthase-like dioxygenase